MSKRILDFDFQWQRTGNDNNNENIIPQAYMMIHNALSIQNPLKAVTFV